VSICAASLATAATCGSVNGGNVAATSAAHALRSRAESGCVELRPERRVVCSPAGRPLISVPVPWRRPARLQPLQRRHRAGRAGLPPKAACMHTHLPARCQDNRQPEDGRYLMEGVRVDVA
jgi:hypothetical protein